MKNKFFWLISNNALGLRVATKIMKISQSLAISQKVDIVCGRSVKYDFSSSSLTTMTTKNFNDIDQTIDTIPTTSSTPRSKFKNFLKAMGVTVLGVLGASNAEAQYLEFGSIPNQNKTTATLNAHDKEEARFNYIAPYQQHFQIIKVNTPNPADWRDDHEVVFETTNNQIIENEIGEAEIRSTIDINGNEARQWIFDNLQPGVYVIKATIWAKEQGGILNERYPHFYIEVDANGNQTIFDGEQTDENPIGYYWDNKIFGNDISLNTVEHSNGLVNISAYVPPIVDPVSGEVGTNMNPFGQQGDYIKVNWEDGSSTLVEKENLIYNTANNTVDFEVVDKNMKVISLESQHAVVGVFPVQDNYMGIEDMTQDKFMMVNPVRSGHDIVFKTSVPMEIALYDMTGKLVLQDTISPSDSTISQQLNSGIYLVHAINPNDPKAKPVKTKLIVQ